MNSGAMKKKPMYSVARTLLGAQSTAYDFAYTDEKYFTTRTCCEHAGMFAAGGAAGVGVNQHFSGYSEKLRDDLPTGYPIDASVEFNERIARLAAENGTIIGPSKFLEVKAGERVFGGVSSFYKEDAPGTTYNNLGMFVEEMLIAIAASGVGVLPIQPDQLLNIASGGNSQLNNSLAQLLGTSFDTASTTTPHAYLVWTAYDSQFRVNLNNSGAIRVLDPNSLERILTESIDIKKDGYLHVQWLLGSETDPYSHESRLFGGVHVSNGSQAAVSFDNFLVQSIRGNVRQIHWLLGAGTWPYSHESRFFSGVNHYYSYGLSIAGLNQLPDDYLHGYQGKELMTGDFVSSSSSGLEMYDFHARLYDPQLGRWFAHDPIKRFSNPYMAMANNPVSFVDPDGKDPIVIGMIVFAVVGAYIGGSSANGGELNPMEWNWQSGDTYVGMGIGAVIGAAAGYGFVVGSPLLANTAFFANFGASGVVVAYTIGGAVSGGAAGYVSGSSGGMLHSNGDFNYSHQAGMFGLQIGASVGSVIGGIYGLGQGVDFSMPVYEEPNYEWNKTETASIGEINHFNMNQDGPTSDDLRRIYALSYNEFQTQLANNGNGIDPSYIYNNTFLTPDPFHIGEFHHLRNTFAPVNHISYQFAPSNSFVNQLQVFRLGELNMKKEIEVADYFTYPGHDVFYNGLSYFKMRIQWWIPPNF